MSVSRDDFSIAFRSALLQRGASQKFSIFSLIIIAMIIFFLDVYGFGVIKTARGVINDKIENFCAPPLWRRAERKAILKSSLLTDIYPVRWINTQITL